MIITLSYQPQQLAPPFAYAAVFKFDLSNGEIKAQLDLEYLGRESVSEEELKADGFTKNDDYSWRGIINPNWKEDVLAFAKMEINSKPDEEIYLHIKIDSKQNGFPKNIEKADILFQELIQAVIEQDQIEAPLKIQLKLNNEPHELTWEFSKRVIQWNGKESNDWEQGRLIMKNIYSIDYDSLTGVRKPVKDCVFLEELWYPINSNLKDQLLSNLKNIS